MSDYLKAEAMNIIMNRFSPYITSNIPESIVHYLVLIFLALVSATSHQLSEIEWSGWQISLDQIYLPGEVAATL